MNSWHEYSRREESASCETLDQFARFFGTPGLMITPLNIAQPMAERRERDIDQVHDSETIYSRGYHAGYARAMTHTDESSWTQRLPMGQLGEVRRALDGAPAKITVDQIEPPNRFGIRFVRVRVDLRG